MRTIITDDHMRAAADGTDEKPEGADEELVGYAGFVDRLTHPEHRQAPTDGDLEGRDLFVERLNNPNKHE